MRITGTAGTILALALMAPGLAGADSTPPEPPVPTPCVGPAEIPPGSSPIKFGPIVRRCVELGRYKTALDTGFVMIALATYDEHRSGDADLVTDWLSATGEHFSRDYTPTQLEQLDTAMTSLRENRDGDYARLCALLRKRPPPAHSLDYLSIPPGRPEKLRHIATVPGFDPASAWKAVLDQPDICGNF